MTRSTIIRASIGATLALVTVFAAVPGANTPLAVSASRITIAGTSNVHDYTATTTDVRVTKVQFGAAATGDTFWQEAQKPGGLVAFEIAIAAATLTSPKDGIDKNMHKALKVKEHADITFSLTRMEGTAGALTAVGVLRIAGVEREVVLPMTTAQKGATLVVSGETDLLMPDYGIAPPKALLGMVKADPKIKVSFEVTLARGTT